MEKTIAAKESSKNVDPIMMNNNVPNKLTAISEEKDDIGVIVLKKRKRKFDLDDPKLFHSLEILGMLCNFVILNSKLGFRARSHLAMGLLGMLAAAQGVWRNWRKVLAKKCGSKHFTPSVLHTPEAPSSPRSPSPSPSPSPRPPSPGSSSDAGDGSEGDSPANSIAGDSPGEEPSLSVS